MHGTLQVNGLNFACLKVQFDLKRYFVRRGFKIWVKKHLFYPEID